MSDKRLTKKQTEDAVKELMSKCPKTGNPQLDHKFRLTDWAEVSLVVNGDLNVRVVTNAYNANIQLHKSLNELSDALNKKVQVTLDGKEIYVTGQALHRIAQEIVRASYRKVRYFQYWVERYFGKVPDAQLQRLAELTSMAVKNGWLDDEQPNKDGE